MNITQISVFLENRPSRLRQVLQVLADRSINIQTLTIAEVSDFGILRLIVNQPEEAYAALKASHITCSRTEVLAVALEDTPGARRRQINIDYMYAFVDRRDAHSIMIFRFEDIEAAKQALAEEGYTVLKQAEVLGQ
jgi:hypothetical protein